MDNSKISARQMQILLVLYIFGFGVLTLPRVMSQIGGQNGWMSVVVAAVFAAASVYIIVTVAQNSGKRRFPEFANSLLGRPLGKLLCLLFAVRLITLAGLRLRIFGESVREYMLSVTPMWLVLGVMLIVCAYAAVKKFEIQARLAEILIFFMIIPIVYVFIVSLRGADFGNLLPLWEATPERVVQGSFRAYFSFGGIELLLLAVPYVNSGERLAVSGKKECVRTRAVSAVAVAGVLMVLVVVAATAVFGADSAARNTWPVFQMMDAAQMPGGFLNRQGAFVMCFWIVSAFAAISLEIFFSSLLIKDVVNAGKRRYYVITLALIVLAIALFPSSLTDTFAYSSLLDTYTAAIFMFAIPFALLIVCNLQNKIRVNPRKSVKSVFQWFLIFPAVTALLLSTACADSKELSDRAFVTAIAVDKGDDEDEPFSITLSVANVEQIGEGDNEDLETLKTTTGATFAAALGNINSSTNNSMFYGHAKLLILGESLLKDAPLLKNTLETLNSKTEINHRIIVLAAEKAGDIPNYEKNKVPLIGFYAQNYFRNNNSPIPRKDLETLTNAMHTGRTALIPKINIVDDGVKISGAAVLSNFEWKGWLTCEEGAGLPWVLGNPRGAHITTNGATLEVTKTNRNIEFYENNGRLQCRVTINVKGGLLSRPFNENTPSLNADNLNALFEHEIKSIINATHNKLYNEFETDGFGLYQLLRNRSRQLFTAHKNDIPNTAFTVEITVDITDTKGFTVTSRQA